MDTPHLQTAPRRAANRTWLMLAVLLLPAAAGPLAVPADRAPQGGDPAAMTRIADDLEAHQIAPGVWRVIAWETLPPFGRTPANNLLIVEGREAAIVNTTWTDSQAGRLAQWIERSFGARVVIVVPTHSHGDTMGGLKEWHRRGAASWASEKTRAIARAKSLEAPRHVFVSTQDLRLATRVLHLAYHGAGHTSDNIVVSLPTDRILFGGCLVRSADAKTLGYLAEADVKAWPATTRTLLDRYSTARIVIPGHGDPGGLDALRRTLELTTAEAARKGGGRS